jgi:hypothetical protein
VKVLPQPLRLHTCLAFISITLAGALLTGSEILGTETCVGDGTGLAAAPVGFKAPAQ